MHFPQNVKLFQKIDRIFSMHTRMHACIDFVIATCFKVVADRCRGKRSLLEYCRKYGHGIVFLIGNKYIWRGIVYKAELIQVVSMFQSWNTETGRLH